MIDFDNDVSILAGTVPMGDGTIGVTLPNGKIVRGDPGILGSLAGKMQWTQAVRDEWNWWQENPPKNKAIIEEPLPNNVPGDTLVPASALEQPLPPVPEPDPVEYARRMVHSLHDQIGLLEGEYESIVEDLTRSKALHNKWIKILRTLEEEE